MSERKRRYRARRARRHILLFASTVGMMGVVDVLNSSDDLIARVSFASAYAALALLCVTFLIGPLNVLRGRPNPTSTYLRRDVGIWAGSVALVHALVGLNVHMRGRFWEYFVRPADQGIPLPRFDAFGLANHAGLGAVVVLALLLALSNDVSLRKLGRERWKALQRWNYGGFALIAAHGVIYQVIEDRAAGWSATFWTMTLLTVGVQAAGFLSRRKASRSGTDSGAR